MKRTLVGLILYLSLLMGAATSVAAQSFEMGLRAYDRRDYATALREWRPLAEHGDAAAQYNLGQMFRKGEGVIRDYKEAVKWFRKSAEQGNATAQGNLGAMYDNGKGVVRDYREAVKWYRLAAEQGNATAQGNLGVMYGSGSGVIQDIVKAHMWLNIGASNGNAIAAKARDYATTLMTESQISKAQQLARECVARNYKGC